MTSLLAPFCARHGLNPARLLLFWCAAYIGFVNIRVTPCPTRSLVRPFRDPFVELLVGYVSFAGAGVRWAHWFRFRVLPADRCNHLWRLRKRAEFPHITFESCVLGKQKLFALNENHVLDFSSSATSPRNIPRLKRTFFDRKPPFQCPPFF
jgi:hypothetical protein